MRGEARTEESIERFRRQALVRVSLLLKTATMHAISNAALQRPIAEALETINRALADGEPLRVQTVGESFFVNNEIVRLDFSSYESGEALRKILKRIGASEIAFNYAPSEADLRSFLELFQSFFRAKNSGEICRAAQGKIRLRPIKHAVEGKAVEIDERQNVLRTFVVLALAIKNAIADTSKKKPARVAQLRRAIHGLADASLDHAALLVAITRLPTLPAGPEFHLAATTALVLLMGRRLGLSRPALSELCLGAALHDLGRAELPEAGGDTKALVESLARVPLQSALRIGRGELSPEVLSYACVALEHQMPLSSMPCASARMIAAPCTFDLLTQASPVRRAVSPDHALSVIRERTDRFDPTVAELFLATVGLFPPGTAVRLSGGENAVVLEAPSDPAAYTEPTVRIVRDAQGRASDEVVDLVRSASRIVRVLDAVEEEVHPAKVLFA